MTLGPWPMIHIDITRNGAGVCVSMCCINVSVWAADRFLQALESQKNSCRFDFAFQQVCVKGMSNANKSSWQTLFLSLSSFLCFLYFSTFFSVAPSSLLLSFSLPLSPRCCPALPAVQRGRPELWDPASGPFWCHLCVRGNYPVPCSLASSCPQTSSSSTTCPAPPLLVPHRLHHQCPKLASPWAPKERRQAFLPTPILISHTVVHTVAGAAGSQEQCRAGGAHRGPEATTRGNTYCTYESLFTISWLIPLNFI